MTNNAFQQLKKQAIANSTYPYKGRGIKVKRCSLCQLMPEHCICNEHPNLSSLVDFVLLYHPDEIFKPTNTGRLIADAFPNNTYAFSHSRTEPQQQLLNLINDPSRKCVIIFPLNDDQISDSQSDNQNNKNTHKVTTQLKPSDKKLTLILLDGTWRQGRRMFNGSQWLKKCIVFKIIPSDKSLYGTRSAACESHLSTAESAALALENFGEKSNAKALFDYFVLFNQRYLKMRSNIKR